jgi:methylisocitrate lyase
MKKTTRLKAMIGAPEILVMHPAHDALSARIAERAGARALTVGGFAASGVLLGQPDSSQLTATELATFYERICASVDIPVFVDADTGFGGVSNVIRTVRDFERAGVAGLFMEDQVFPKRCGHTAGKSVVSTDDMVAKLEAALDHRIDQDLVIMGRTDALGVLGLEEAIERAALYRASAGKWTRPCWRTWSTSGALRSSPRTSWRRSASLPPYGPSRRCSWCLMPSRSCTGR